jgi:hypothetical protein
VLTLAIISIKATVIASYDSLTIIFLARCLYFSFQHTNNAFYVDCMNVHTQRHCYDLAGFEPVSSDVNCATLQFTIIFSYHDLKSFVNNETF